MNDQQEKLKIHSSDLNTIDDVIRYLLKKAEK